MQKKLYATPVLMSHDLIRFATEISSACADNDKDGGYVNGIYVDNDGDGD